MLQAAGKIYLWEFFSSGRGFTQFVGRSADLSAKRLGAQLPEKVILDN
jgi:hypothetical protein